MDRIAVIGFGAMGRLLVERLGNRVVAVIEQPALLEKARDRLKVGTRAVATVAEAIEVKPTLFVECAGHVALAAHGIAVLRSGTDLLVASVGALADASLDATLRKAGASSKAALMIPSGALGGLDALGAARYAGLDSVTYSSTKSVRAWRGTHAESLIDLNTVNGPIEFFAGSARDAARLFPLNANVAAAVALAGIGFEATRVTLIADPDVKGNRHRIRAIGQFGEIDAVVEGRPLPDNPKTSMLAPMSLLRAIDSRSAAVRIV